MKLERYLTLIALIVLVPVGLIAIYIIRSAIDRPALLTVVEYRYPILQPVKSDLCPGDILTYRQEFFVRVVPSTIQVVYTVWNVQEDRTAIPANGVQIYNFIEPVTVRRIDSYALPSDFPTGAYELRVSSSSDDGRRPALFRVPFSIDSGCPT